MCRSEGRGNGGGKRGSKVLSPYGLWRLCGLLQFLEAGPRTGAPASELRFPWPERQSRRERVSMLRIGNADSMDYQEHLIILQRIRIQFPAPMLGSL